jgi:hypothetical protein
MGSPNMTVSVFTMPLQCGQRGGISSVGSSPRIAVDLGDGDASRLLVQVIDVLGDGVLEKAHLLQVGHREVGQVGLGLVHGLLELGVLALAAEDVGPPGARVGHEALIAVHGRLAVLGPEAAGASEGRHAALH